MEERLISSVANYPELYNSTLRIYKDSDKKVEAWRAVSLQVGLPEEDCRRKWKSLRDKFIKDRKSEQRIRASGGSHRTWKYSQLMAFLTPFIQSRSSTSSVAAEEMDEDGEEEMPVNSSTGFAVPETDARLGETGMPAQFPPSGLPVPNRKRWPTAGLDGLEDEMFLMSLLPHLKRLPYERKCSIKLKFHQLLYEAEFQ